MNEVSKIQRLGVICGILLLGVNARGQSRVTEVAERALPGLIRVGLPVPTAPAAVTAGVGYGWLDPTQGQPGGQRFQGQIAAALTPFSPLSIALDLRGRIDAYSPASTGAQVNGYGEPRLTVRYAAGLTDELFLGAELDARLIGKHAPSIDFAATSPSLRALGAWRLSPSFWLGANLGFQLDRSDHAVPHPELVSAPDKRSLGASSWNAVQWGLGASYQLPSAPIRLLAELSGEAVVGAGSPSIVRSPARVSVGGHYTMHAAWSAVATLEAALSSRAPELPSHRLLPADPRVSAGVALVWRFDTGKPAAAESPAEPAKPVEPTARPAEPPPPAPVPRSSVAGSVVDEGGRPLADVEVSIVQTGSEAVTVRTFADGTFQFKDVPVGAVELRVTTPGYDAEVITLDGAEPRQREIALRPTIPAGQVRGAVLDFEGKPVAALVTLKAGDKKIADKKIEVRPDGSFELELAPGTYTVIFEAPNYGAQRRTIRVRDHGVVILNIALVR
jgi:Carboxypeptidase regulatory-like domain